MSGTAARCRNGDSSTIQLGGVYIVLDDGEALRAGWVAGCDGAHSRVRAAAVIELPGVLLVERFLLADVHVDLGLGEGHAAADGLVDLAPRALAGRQQLVAGSAERAARIRVAHEVFGWLVGGTGPMIEVGRAGKAGRHR
jgi:2-polyprenyl-6-methoxyphenol hydroxylase-like FAD-dependent oxidoreductase